MESSILLELERAEVAARERRLAAEAEAERALVDARARASAIQAGVEQAVADAIEARRLELEAEADREIAAIEGELAAVGERGRLTQEDRSFRTAVRLVVGAVLAENAEGDG